MKYYKLISRLILMILPALFCSCKQKNKAEISKVSVSQIAANSSQDSAEAFYDTSIALFGDTSYKLNIHAVDRKMSPDANATLTLEKNQRGQQSVILMRDRIETMDGSNMEFEDFNNDKIKDLLVFYSDGARANPRYHLYLINPKSHELIRVKGFEELTNPKFDSKNNIIVSIGLSGSDYYSFYRITHTNKLINLGHSFEISENCPKENSDSAQYDDAIKHIIKENQIE